jgi:hypothetical protein
MKTGIWFVWVMATLLTGCMTAPPKGQAELLRFLTDGQTTRQNVILTLGQPSALFEKEKVFTYRLGYEPKTRGYYIVEREPPNEAGWSTWWHAKYSLVLVFDDTGVLRRHSLVEVN